MAKAQSLVKGGCLRGEVSCGNLLQGKSTGEILAPLVFFCQKNGWPIKTIRMVHFEEAVCYFWLTFGWVGLPQILAETKKEVIDPNLLFNLVLIRHLIIC